MVDSRATPVIDPTFFPAAPSSFFWSSTPVAGSPANGQGVDFVSGTLFNFVGATTLGRARCVRRTRSALLHLAITTRLRCQRARFDTPTARPPLTLVHSRC